MKWFLGTFKSYLRVFVFFHFKIDLFNKGQGFYKNKFPVQISLTFFFL